MEKLPFSAASSGLLLFFCANLKQIVDQNTTQSIQNHSQEVKRECYFFTHFSKIHLIFFLNKLGDIKEDTILFKKTDTGFKESLYRISNELEFTSTLAPIK